MKKRYITTLLGAVGAGALVSYFLSDINDRESLKSNFSTACQKMVGIITHNDSSTLEDAGIPGQVEGGDVAQMENADMVSEGSQYGVNYYNEVRDEQKSKNETSQS